MPNPAARALVTQRTDTVALVIAESEERVFGEPFFAGVVRGISAALATADLQLVLLLAQSAHRTGEPRAYLIPPARRRRAAAVAARRRPAAASSIRARGLPVVLGGAARWT